MCRMTNFHLTRHWAQLLIEQVITGIELIHYVAMMTSPIESKTMIKYITLFAIVCVVIWTGGVVDLIVTIPCFPALLPPKPIDKN
jgi:hypothetical protein